MFKDRVILVDILALIFGIGAWIEVNGVWVETPILVQKLPEEWKLSSYLVLIIQLSNIGPIVYSIIKSKFSLESIERPAVHLNLFIGAIACVFLSLFWDQISIINGSKHSLTFLVLTVLFSVANCTTPLLFIPFMAHFKPKYLMSYIIGQELSEFIPSLIAIIQGVGGSDECVNSTLTSNITGTIAEIGNVPEYIEPNFSVSAFFAILFCIVLMSWLAFILLNHLECCQSEWVSNECLSEMTPKPEGIHNETVNQSTDNYRSVAIKERNTSELILTESNKENIWHGSFIVLLVTQAYICALSYGILPSIQSYSCLPYGTTAFHLTVTLNGVANPIACFITFFVSLPVLKKTLPLVIFLGSLCAGYITIIAVLSPTPPLHDSLLGKVLIVFTWVAFTALVSYIRACIASILRNTSAGHKALFFCGAFRQIGSTFGAILMFLLINYTNIFIEKDSCL